MKHLIVGAGPIGSGVARILASQGDTVCVATRSGSGPELPDIARVAVDASDPAALLAQARGVDVIYNCANPAYHRWTTDWPPIANSLLAAAISTGAVLVTAANLYGYGPVDAPMTEHTPLAAAGKKAMVRVQMWKQTLAASTNGQLRMAEARGADYVGPEAESHLGARTIPGLLAGKKVRVLGSPDTAHTWTYTEDMARTLVALGTDERAWGRAWHVPSALTCSQREALHRIASLAGAPEPTIAGISPALLKVLGIFSPMMRELPEVAYQLERPFIMDSMAAQTELGLEPTPPEEVLAAILAPFHHRSGG